MALSFTAASIKPSSPSPLVELEEIELYQMLGEAWYARFRPELSICYYLAPPAEIGRREYDALLPKLRENLARPHQRSAISCVASTIQRAEMWRMPATVVAALAIKQGLVRA